MKLFSCNEREVICFVIQKPVRGVALTEEGKIGSGVLCLCSQMPIRVGVIT